MSRDDMFDGLDVEPQPGREVYLEGKESIESRLAQELIHHLVEGVASAPVTVRKLIIRAVYKTLPEDLSSIDTEEFFDQYFLCFKHYGTPFGTELSLRVSDYLVQCFYDDGLNNPTLDLSCWINVGQVGQDLKGTKEEPLTVHYRGKPWELGTGASFCSFTLDGELKYAGLGATECEFYLPSMNVEILLDYIDSVEYYSQQYADGHAAVCPVPQRCTYYVKEGIDVEELRKNPDVMNLWQTFTMDCNKIYVPDDDGEWTEVKL